ncbi:MAG: TRAP transporter substrate-binding protein [Succinivibrio sp.]|nr:TRAP transporter substrate-binding protein [Succinivibrio sp.]
MKSTKTLFATALMALALGAASASVQARELKLGHGMPVNNAQHIGLQAFADEVKKLSNGELTVTIFPKGELGTEKEMAEKTLMGELDICKIGGMLAEAYEPRYGIMCIPYLFHDYDHVKAFIRSDLPEKYFFNQSKEIGLIGLFLIASGTRDFYLSKPIKSVEDFKGLKIRVPENKMSMLMIKALGATPTPISWSDVTAALKNGVVDGAENNITSWVEQGHMESCPYLILDDHLMNPDVVFISETTWDSLSKEERKILKEAAKVGIETEIAEWDKKEAENLAKAKVAGKTFIEVDKQLFRDKVASLLDNERKTEGFSEIIDAILALAKK